MCKDACLFALIWFPPPLYYSRPSPSKGWCCPRHWVFLHQPTFKTIHHRHVRRPTWSRQLLIKTLLSDDSRQRCQLTLPSILTIQWHRMLCFCGFPPNTHPNQGTHEVSLFFFFSFPWVSGLFFYLCLPCHRGSIRSIHACHHRGPFSYVSPRQQTQVVRLAQLAFYIPSLILGAVSRFFILIAS